MIIERCGAEFEQAGVANAQLPNELMQALAQNNIVGTVGRDRPVFQVLYNDAIYYLAITVGDNGNVVGAQIAGVPHPQEEDKNMPCVR